MLDAGPSGLQAGSGLIHWKIYRVEQHYRRSQHPL